MKKCYVFCCILLLSASYVQHAYTMQGYDDVPANQAAENEQCTICLDDMVYGDRHDPRERLACGHKFHNSCINRWRQERWYAPNCPICRSRVQIAEDYPDPNPGEQPVQPVQEAPIVQAVNQANQAQPEVPAIQAEQERQTTMQQLIALLRELGLLDNLIQPLRVIEPRVRLVQVPIQAPAQAQPAPAPHAQVHHVQVNPVQIDQPLPQEQIRQARSWLNRRSVIAGTALVVAGALAYKLRKPIIKLYNQTKAKIHATYRKLLALGKLKSQKNTTETQLETQ